MTSLTSLTYYVILMYLSITNANKVNISGQNDDKCNLNVSLVNEIKSYKELVDQMVLEIDRSCGDILYDEYTKFMTAFGNRPSGSPILEDSIDYMINLTQAYELSHFHTERVHVPHWVRGEETLEMITPRRKKMQILGLGSSVSTPKCQYLKGITAKAIVVKSFQELEKLHSDKVEGKIVVYNQDYVSFSETSVYMSQGASKAAQKGAIAALIRSVTPLSLYTPHTGHQKYFENVTQIPVASITVEDAELLWRLQSFNNTITLKLKMSNTFDVTLSRNLVVDFKGEESPEKAVIVSGHIDSWDVGDGAINNGGGTFISWTVNAALKKLPSLVDIKYKIPRRTVRSILWTGGETGHNGALSYFHDNKKELSNIDFIMESYQGTFKPLGLEVAGNKEARCIIAEILKLFKTNKFEENAAVGWDIAEFIKEGVPGASLLTQNERFLLYYNSEADTMEVQKKQDLVESAAFWTALTYVIADLSVDIPR